ncbi:DUF4157 domain-containing protein, partial [Aquimarina litoralis]|uniref:eCIS core domain-containing protein n=1 Tax=Aquimarina litoralis TaxID=584605 RepID=UPI001C56BCF8
AQLQAHAYARGTDIHLAPGQEKHLPHEAWHVVQQKQGRVKPTMQFKGKTPINDDVGLEKEADVMGVKALQNKSHNIDNQKKWTNSSAVNRETPIQRKTGIELELHVPVYGKVEYEKSNAPNFSKKSYGKGLTGTDYEQLRNFLGGGLKYGVKYGVSQDDLYDISADHGEYQTVHSSLIKHLKLKGYLSNWDKFKPEAMTNIEYRSRPFEERKRGENYWFHKMAGDIQHHAQDTANKATSNKMNTLKSPVENLYTGVPVESLEKLLKGDSEGTKIIKELTNIKPNILIQTNTGVLPSEMEEFFKEGGDRMIKNKKSPTPSVIADILISSVEVVKGLSELVVKLCSKQNKNVTKEEIEAVKGWILLLAQYIFGYELQQTNYLSEGVTSKALLPYLSKTPVKTSLRALPDAIRPFMAEEGVGKFWKTLLSIKLPKVIKEHDLITRRKLKPRESQQNIKKVLSPDPTTWVLGLFNQTTKKVTTINSGNPLGLDKEDEGQSGELSFGGQHGIVLEDRYNNSKIDDPYAIDKIAEMLRNEWELAKERRMKSTTTSEVDFSLPLPEWEELKEKVKETSTLLKDAFEKKSIKKPFYIKQMNLLFTKLDEAVSQDKTFIEKTIKYLDEVKNILEGES